MTEDELQEKIKYVQQAKFEAQTLELKAAHEGCPQKLYDTLSSFSNQDGGGTILFGIDETSNFSPVGVYDAQDIQKKINAQCLQMEPVVRPVLTVTIFPPAFHHSHSSPWLAGRRSGHRERAFP